jgi:phenylacetate-CoA ligase
MNAALRGLRRQVIHHTLVPIAARTVRRATWREYRRLRALERADPRALRARQLARLRPLIAWAYETVPYYRAAMLENGVAPADIDSLDRLALLPILTKRTVQASGTTLLSSGADPKHRFARATSGTTGTPLRFYRDRRASPLGQATWWQALHWTGASPADPLVYSILPRPAGEEERLGFWNRLIGTRVLTYHPGVSFDRASVLRALAPAHHAVLALFPSYLHLLAQGLVAAGCPGVIRPRCIFSFGEHLTEDTRALVRQAFDAPIRERYGAMEFSAMIAQTCGHGGWHLNTEGFVVEIVGGAAGDRHGSAADRGRIVITDLRNFVMPFIRYEVGDIGVRGDEVRCGCGRTLPRLGAIEGRDAEYVVTPAGRRVPSSAFQRVLRPYGDALWEYQLRQDDPAAVEVWIVPRGQCDETFMRALATAVECYLLREVSVSVRAVDWIPREASGKRPLLKSTVAGYTLAGGC